ELGRNDNSASDSKHLNIKTQHQVHSMEKETTTVTTYPSDGSAKTSVPSEMPPKPAY
nr:opacity protein P.IIe - Neisseria gonorrhoeae (strain FA1090) (fragments) [Neisseria gonorrhoeae]